MGVNEDGLEMESIGKLMMGILELIPASVRGWGGHFQCNTCTLVGFFPIVVLLSLLGKY